MSKLTGDQEFNGNVYVKGVGGYDGTNASASSTLQQALSDVKCLTEITWSNLKSLRDSNGLIPGAQYRITDYQCTVDTADTSALSAGHQFDIIVTADSENTLNEDARTCLHSGDTYFASCNLDAWELKYCLDNDSDRFKWADEEETIFATGNNIFYRRYPKFDGRCQDTGYEYAWIPTGMIPSSDDDDQDACFTVNTTPENGDIIKDSSGGNLVITATSVILGKGVIYWMKDEWNNECPYDFKNIMFKRKLTNGELDTDAGTYTWVYTFNAFNSDNSTISDASVIVGKDLIDDGTQYCAGNIIKPYSSGGSGGRGIDISYSLNSIVFLNIYSIEGLTYFTCYSNTFENGCYSNTFGNGCNSNTFGDSCYNNAFGTNCVNNTFGYNCNSNTFGDACYSNTFGDNCYNNTFGNNCISNTFGNDCNNIKFGTPSLTVSYCSYNIVENGNQYIYIYATSTSSNSQYKNVKISQGVNNTTTYKTITDGNVNQTYQTIYMAGGGMKYVDSSGHTINMPTVTKDTTLATVDDLDNIDIELLTSSELNFIFGIMKQSIKYLAALYIDDFEDGHGGNVYAQDMGYQDIQHYINAVCAYTDAAGHVGTNIFVPTADTLEYEGVEYRVWYGFTANPRTGGYDWRTNSEFYGLAPLDLDYDTVYPHSMEQNITNYYCPFVLVNAGGNDYDDPQRNAETYRLICAKQIDLTQTPIDPSHSSEITKIYMDDYHDYGLYISMINNGCETLDDYIQYAKENDNYYYDSGETMEYEGVTYKLFRESASRGLFYGLLPQDLTYQEVYSHSLECNGNNINYPYNPFVALGEDRSNPRYTGDEVIAKCSSVTAVE